MRWKPTEDERREYLQRLKALEKRVVLPARIAVLVPSGVILWPLLVHIVADKELGFFKWSTLAYAALCVAYWVYLFHFARLVRNLTLTIRVVFASALTDNVFLGLLFNAAVLTSRPEHWLVTGPEASLFWAYCALIVRNTFLFPSTSLQTFINSVSVLGYVAAQLFDVRTLHPRDFTQTGLGELIFRVIVLVLVTICSSAIYSLIQRRRRELDDAHEKTIRSQRLDMASMIAAQVAHELKNPLSIMTNAAFLLRRSKQGLDPNLSQQIEIIEEEINRADQIVRELLDYGKLSEAKIEAVLVNDSIDESVAGLKNELESRKIQVQRNYSFDLPYLFIDPSQIRQVFTNILLNACEAIQNGGKISLSTSYSTDGFIQVSIADTGKGMEPHVLSEMFKPFFTTKEKGTGMGLTIVQNVLRAYSGEVTAESEPGKGTTFHLRFPTRMATRLKASKSREPQSGMRAALKTIQA